MPTRHPLRISILGLLSAAMTAVGVGLAVPLAYGWQRSYHVADEFSAWRCALISGSGKDAGWSLVRYYLISQKGRLLFMISNVTVPVSTEIIESTRLNDPPIDHVTAEPDERIFITEADDPPKTLWNHLGLYFPDSTVGVCRQTGVAMPYWMALSLVGAFPLWQLARGVRRVVRRINARRAAARGEVYCLNCGYDLRATPDRCPECGTIVKR